jgi:hypothetical protein
MNSRIWIEAKDQLNLSKTWRKVEDQKPADHSKAWTRFKESKFNLSKTQTQVNKGIIAHYL